MHKVCLNSEARQIQSAWGTFIEELADWKHFVTLTMRDKERKSDGQKYSPGIISCRKMWQSYVDYCRLFTSEVSWISVYELQRERDVYHVHGLVAGPFERGVRDVLPDLRSWAWQNWGFNRVLEFLPAVGAAGYIGKYLVKEEGDVEFSAGLRRRILEEEF